MPWCDGCQRYWAPPTLVDGRQCPTCADELVAEAAPPRAPWHFRLLVGAGAVYLGVRFVQGVEWVLHRR